MNLYRGLPGQVREALFSIWLKSTILGTAWTDQGILPEKNIANTILDISKPFSVLFKKDIRSGIFSHFYRVQKSLILNIINSSRNVVAFIYIDTINLKLNRL